MSVSPVATPVDNNPLTHNKNTTIDNQPVYKGVNIEPDFDSCASDYSEMADSVKEHLANMQYLQQTEQKSKHLMDDNQVIDVDNETHNVLRNADESDEDYSRRVRKINLLSLAQEFAALKQVDTEALPFNMHKTNPQQQDYSPMSEVSTESESEGEDQESQQVAQSNSKHKQVWPHSTAQHNKNQHPSQPPSAASATSHTATVTSGGGKKSPSPERLQDFDVYNIESTLPDVMDWTQLEQQLQKAAEEQHVRQSRRNDREEIRRKLAMGGTGDEDYYAGERTFKKPNLQSRLQGGMNLQICFMNEAAPDDGAVPGNSADTAATDLHSTAQGTDPHTTAPPPTGGQQAERRQGGEGEGPKKDEDFFTKQERLQNEAKMALAQVRPMAYMQLQVEKEQKKKSPISEIVGLPKLGAHAVRTRQTLSDMNIAQLQVVVNDMHTQIENLNDELVRMLLQRDELHMEQDSMLVDIEDHTRRAQECAQQHATRTQARQVNQPRHT